jgi:acyl dehydratase
MSSPASASPFLFAVEAGKIREVADALRDPREIFRSEEAARAAGHPGIPAPIVFSRTTAFVAPLESSLNAQGRTGAEPSRGRHAGQEWIIRRPLYAGRSYQVTPWRVVADTTRRSRTGGGLRFLTGEREFRDTGDSCVVMTERMTGVVLEASPVRAAPPSDIAARETPAETGAQRRVRTFASEWRRALPGAPLAEVEIGPLRLTDFVRFAGAIGDFTPIHHDAEHARRYGLVDVIAMGTLPAGLSLSLIEQGYGLAAIEAVQLRFHEPLYVNRGVNVSVVAGARSSERAPCAELRVSDSRGAPILSGSVRASARMDAPE